jgi:hypothetical protein
MNLSSTTFRWLRSAAGHTAFWLGLPLLLYLPTITGPFAFDDLSLVLKAEQYARGETDQLGLFRFAPTDQAWRELHDRGTFPWWSPAHLKIDFFRPLAEWSFYIDMGLFGRNAMGHRAVSLIWFAVVLMCLHRLFQAACGDSVRAGAATFFFGISQTATQPVTFICNRSDLLVLMGVSLAAWAYWSAGDRPRKSLVAVAALGFAFALLSKEIAVGLAGVIVLHEMIVRRRRIPLAGGYLRGVIACVVACMAAIYLAYFVTTHPWLIGLGKNDQDLNNLSILARAPRALPLYLSVWTAGFPINTLFDAGAGPVVMVGAAGLLLAAIVAHYLVKAARTNRAVLFFALWAVVFMLLGLMTVTETRVLCVATVGWAYLLSALLTPSAEATPAPALLRHWLLATSGIVSIICAVATVVVQNNSEDRLRNILRERLAAQDRPLADGNTLVVSEAESGFELILAPERVEFMTGLRGIGVAFLTLPGARAHVERKDDRTLVLTSANNDLLDESLYGLSLGQLAARRPGQTFDTRDFTAQIGQIADDGRITSLVFRFKEPLTSGRLRFHPPALAAVARGEK